MPRPARVVLSLLAALASAILHAAAPQPNIVFILADDLGWAELGCYGQARIRTPNIDRLATQGRRFTRHYSGAPVCAPSRCVLMTGRHLGHAEIRGNLQAKDAGGKPAEGQHPLSTNAVTLASVLRNAGYDTAAFGKWGLGRPDSSGAPHLHGFDLFFGYNCQAQAHSYYPAHLWRNTVKVPLNAQPIPGHARQPEGPVDTARYTGERRAPEVMLTEAVRFLETPRDRPFFLYLPFIEPHVALQPPPDLVDSYPADWDDRPYRGQCAYTPHPRPRAAYAALITALDRHVGVILDTLERRGLTTNTLVVFTSDNGTTHPSPGDPTFGVGGVDGAFFNSTGPLRGRKGSVLEGGIRVPLIVRWPGRVPAGTESAVPGYFADHLPTLCAAAGIKPPPGLDGIDLLPSWTGNAPLTRTRPMIWVFPEYGGQVAVNTGRFKALRRDLHAKDGPGPWEVYDLDSDPGESRNLALQRPDLIHEAEAILARETVPNATFPVRIP